MPVLAYLHCHAVQTFGDVNWSEFDQIVSPSFQNQEHHLEALWLSCWCCWCDYRQEEDHLSALSGTLVTPLSWNSVFSGVTHKGTIHLSGKAVTITLDEAVLLLWRRRWRSSHLVECSQNQSHFWVKVWSTSCLATLLPILFAEDCSLWVYWMNLHLEVC